MAMRATCARMGWIRRISRWMISSKRWSTMRSWQPLWGTGTHYIYDKPRVFFMTRPINQDLLYVCRSTRRVSIVWHHSISCCVFKIESKRSFASRQFLRFNIDTMKKWTAEVSYFLSLRLPWNVCIPIWIAECARFKSREESSFSPSCPSHVVCPLWVTYDANTLGFAMPFIKQCVCAEDRNELW